ncbi:hypothetical protein [Adlercreutzia sp. ZJ176]|uniref:hypothetical protein n=2 Tax=unclassified Adlercreutzia TaxID=2636013 RepID=UPI001F150A14|nr:hypothetical protein [Adlercreutzia sp. ZJ176]
MSSITDGFRDAFLAGVGAVAMGAEKSKELVEQLIAKGEITVDQGRQLNEELKHQAVTVTATLREESIAAQLSAMTAQEREAFAAKVAEMAAAANAKDALKDEPADAPAAPEPAAAEPAPAAPAPAEPAPAEPAAEPAPAEAEAPQGEAPAQ